MLILRTQTEDETNKSPMVKMVAHKTYRITALNFKYDRLCGLNYVIISLAGVFLHEISWSQIAKFMGPTWGPPGSCRPQMGPMLAQWTCYQGSTFTLSNSHQLDIALRVLRWWLLIGPCVYPFGQFEPPNNNVCWLWGMTHAVKEDWYILDGLCICEILGGCYHYITRN